MINKIRSEWENIINFMMSQYDISDVAYNAWLKDLIPYKLVGTSLYILSPDNPRIVSIVDKKYKDILNISLIKILGEDLTPIFISEEYKERVNELSLAKSNIDTARINFNDFVRKRGLNPKFTFESFVSGKSNELAHAASLAVAENPGQEYRILYLYGGVGLGKTHLMQAIANYILKNDPDADVFYTTSENFTNEYINSIKKNITDDFRDKYRRLDVLLIDDIQFIANKESTQEEFFNTFNTLFNLNKQIVITSDKPPKDINNLEERIRSRFEGGMIVDIQPPNFETRLAILRKKEELEGYDIDDEVLKYIAANIKSNIRTLEGSLQRIVLKSKLEKTPIDVDTAASILVDVIGGNDESNVIAPEKIVSTVAEHFGISETELVSSKKNKELSYPRQIAMYLCCNMTDATQKNIGLALGGRDHATIIHGRDKIAEDMKTNEKLALDIDILKKKILP